MNSPVRKLSLVVAALFASLLVSTTLIQYVFAADLNARPDNRRTLLSTFARERGEILVGETPIARSVPSDDEYKYQREYPEGPLYAHVTGFYSFFGAQGGLEQAENALLSGSSDKLFYRRVSDLFTGRRPQGATLETTLDAKVQAAAEEALDGIRGAAVALDPKTGAILAMVSHPTYDPNDLATTTSRPLEKNYARLNEDPAKPLVNRSINATSTRPARCSRWSRPPPRCPAGEYTEDTVVPGPAVLDLPQTDADLPNAFDGAVRAQQRGDAHRGARGLVQHRLRPDRHGHRRRGAPGPGGEVRLRRLDHHPHAGHPEHGAGRDEPAAARAGRRSGSTTCGRRRCRWRWSRRASATDGTVMRPYLVQSVIGSDLAVIESTDPQELSQAVTPEVAAQLTRMMVAVVEDGSGRRAQIAGRRGRRQDRHGPARRGPQGARVVHLVRAGGRPGDRRRRDRRGRRGRRQRGRRRRRRRTDRQADDGSQVGPMTRPTTAPDPAPMRRHHVTRSTRSAQHG